MTTPDYKALRGTDRERFQQFGRPKKFSDEVRAERDAERARRQGVARNRAHTVLARLHRDDFRALYQQALAEVYEERGPLPGDVQ